MAFKNNFTKSIKITFLIGMIAIGFISCDKNPFCINGEGSLVTETLNLNAFSSIDLANSATVIISQGTTQEVVVTGQHNIIDALKRTVTNMNWEIDFEDNTCYNYDELTIRITIPNLSAADISGSGDITINRFTNQSDFSTNISGSGELDIADFTHQGDLDVSISGSGNVELGKLAGTQDVNVSVSGSGELGAKNNITNVNAVAIDVSGSGSVDCFPILANEGTVDISGSGSCEILANNNLNISISGSGSVYYKGMATVVQSISGSGSVVNSN